MAKQITEESGKTNAGPDPRAGLKRLTKAQLWDRLAALEQAYEALGRERDDLELLLQTTTDHSDNVEEELHDRAEQALRRSEQQLRMIVEATPVPVLISARADGRILYANAEAGPLLGLDATAPAGHRALEFYHDPQDRRRLLAALDRDGVVDRYEIRLKKHDGEPFWAELSLRRLTFDGQPSLLTALHDITERKQAVDTLTGINRALSRFVPSAFLKFLDKQDITEIRLGDHVSREMTVMFSDLRSFTRISEQMTPQQNFDFVNAYLRRVSPLVGRHGGFIVKYLGDGLMAVFPRRPDDAARGALAAVAEVADYNRYRERQGRQPIQIGIGINTGHIMVGMVGDENRIQGDAFSDAVNLTSRVENLTKFYGVPLIVTDATRQGFDDPAAYRIRFLDKVQVYGRGEALQLYEIFDADPAPQAELKQATLGDYREALTLFYARDFAGAQAKLFAVLQRNPKDKVAWHHLVRATQLAEEGATEDWTGVTVMAMK